MTTRSHQVLVAARLLPSTIIAALFLLLSGPSQADLTINELIGFGPFSQGGNDANTILLLHADGAGGSTSFIDSSRSKFVVTPSGQAQIDTSQSKFGGTSALFDGTNDYLSITDSATFAFGTGDFTIDLWVKFAAFTNEASDGFFWFINSGDIAAASSLSFHFDYRSSTNILQFGLSDGATTTVKQQSWTPLTNTWYHVAAVRGSNMLYIFVDGVMLGTGTAYSSSLNDAAIGLTIGAAYNSATFVREMNGWIDELRLSNVARWTSNFVPPSRPYD